MQQEGAEDVHLVTGGEADPSSLMNSMASKEEAMDTSGVLAPGEPLMEDDVKDEKPDVTGMQVHFRKPFNDY